MSTYEDTGEAGTEALVQRIVLRVAEQHQGAPPSQVRTELEAALADAGLPEQPERWVATTAEEISAGRVVITDPAVEHEVHRWRDSSETPEAEGPPPGQG